MSTYAAWIRARSDTEFKTFYRESVVKPFVAPGSCRAGGDKDVRTYLRGVSLPEQLVKAQAAGERMGTLLGRLSRRRDDRRMQADLARCKQPLDAVSAYRKAKAGG